MAIYAITTVFFVLAFVYQTKKRFDAEVDLKIRDVKWNSYLNGIKEIRDTTLDQTVRDTLSCVVNMLEHK